MDLDIRTTYVYPSWTHSMEYNATYPYSGLIQHAYLTNKHNYFKKTRGWVTLNNTD